MRWAVGTTGTCFIGCGVETQIGRLYDLQVPDGGFVCSDGYSVGVAWPNVMVAGVR